MATVDRPLSAARVLHRTMPTQIADALAAEISEGGYAPGDRVNENAIALAWGVSRAPVREALRMLETRGLVVITPQRGARVTSLSQDEVDYLFDIRSVLVGLAARRAAERFDPSVAKTLESLLAGLEQSLADGEQYAKASARAALIITESAGNPKLLEMVVSFAHQLSRYARLGLSSKERRVRSLENWRLLVEAIRKNDGDAAEVHQRRLAAENRAHALVMLKKQIEENHNGA